VTSSKDAAGREDKWEYALNTSRVVALKRTAANDLGVVGDPKTLAEYEYSNGNLARVKEHDLNGGTTTTTLDALGRPITVEYSSNDLDRLTYDDLGMLKTMCQGATADGCRHALSVSWDIARSKQTTSAADGLFEETTLDARQRPQLVRRGYSASTPDDEVTTLTYDVDGRAVTMTTDVKNGSSTRRHAQSTLFFDSAQPRRAEQSETVQRTRGASLLGTTTTTFDDRNRPAVVALTGTLHPGSPTTTFTYQEDSARYVNRVSHATIGVPSAGYDQVDGFGRTIESSTTIAGQPSTKRIRFLGNNRVREAEMNGEIIRLETTFTMDGRGRPTLVQRPTFNGLIEQRMRYDVSNSTFEEHFVGGILDARYERSYDDGGRIKLERYSTSAGVIYDRARAWTDGRHATLVDAATLAVLGTEEYDGRGRLVVASETDGVDTLITAYERDALSALERVVLPSGYGPSERLYQASGRPLSVTTPNGDKIIYGYEGNEEPDDAPQRRVLAADADKARQVDSSGAFIEGNPEYCDPFTEPRETWMAELILSRRYQDQGAFGVVDPSADAENEYGTSDRTLWPCDVRLIVENPEPTSGPMVAVEIATMLPVFKVGGTVVASVAVAGAGVRAAETIAAHEAAETLTRSIAARAGGLVHNTSRWSAGPTGAGRVTAGSLDGIAKPFIVLDNNVLHMADSFAARGYNVMRITGGQDAQIRALFGATFESGEAMFITRNFRDFGGMRLIRSSHSGGVAAETARAVTSVEAMVQHPGLRSVVGQQVPSSGFNRGHVRQFLQLFGGR
jgi:hypothetical protein